MYSVLVVDDESAITFILRMLLEEEGFQVETASSAREAIEILGHKKFDGVVTDIRMETPSAGFDVVRAAKALIHPPVVVIMTAFPVLPQVWKSTGADDLMVKGNDQRSVAGVLKQLLALREGASEAPVRKKKVVNE